jgi:hypothetical protein
VVGWLVGGELDEIDVLCVFKSTADELVITVIFGFVNCRVHSLIPDIFVLVVDLLWTRRKVQLHVKKREEIVCKLTDLAEMAISSSFRL